MIADTNDLNYLHSRHQISLINAAAATSLEARSAHGRLAVLYADRINKHRLSLPAGSAALLACR
jgi:hypothetical protein